MNFWQLLIFFVQINARESCLSVLHAQNAWVIFFIFVFFSSLSPFALVTHSYSGYPQSYRGWKLCAVEI